MADSLRLRLLVWYAAILMLVVGMVGVAVCVVTWRSRLATVDAELGARAVVVATSVERRADGAFDVELPSDATAYFQESPARPYYAVWDEGGRLIDRTDPDFTASGAPEPRARTRGSHREVVVSSRGFTVLIGRDIGDVRGELWSLAGTIAMVALAGVAASLGGAWFLAGRALAPVQRINETARRMVEGDLSAQIAVERTDTELGQVASALNLAFDRLRESVERQRRFTADASHELRTPVTTMMAELEWALLRDRSTGDYKESLETCHRAGARMQSLVEGLLTLARADSGELPVRQVPVRLDELIDEAVDLLRPLAEQRHVTLRVSATAQTIVGDPDRLRELLSNLLFNGVAYNRPNGLVIVDVQHEGATVVLRVRDTGIGIDPDDLPHVFDRFYRGELARAREPAGAGLGLALVHWIVGAHSGTVACTSEPGSWTEFVVRLPAVTTQLPRTSYASASLVGSQ
jgi:two-component system, OmpR family, sensor kinase